MKKKVKLFSTIASLCLAVALMAFGVYAAAQSVKFKTSSSIQFTATTDVYGTFTASVKKNSEAATTITSTRANVAGSSWNTTGATTEALMGAGATLGTGLELTAVNDVYTFTYTFANSAPYAISATVVTDGLTSSIKQVNTPAEDAITVVDAADKSTTIGVGGSKTWTITVTLKSLDIAANKTIDVPFEVTLVKAEA